MFIEDRLSYIYLQDKGFVSRSNADGQLMLN